MGKDRGPWQDARRAWERLTGWHQNVPSTTPVNADDGDEALTALADIGLLRRLLDQAELDAVRTARRRGRSWTEIAVRLGVTRQSAWERWRDLDEAPSPQPSDGLSRSGVIEDVEARAAAELARQAPRRPEGVPAEVVERAAGQLRRRSAIVVPNVIGMSWDAARRRLTEKGLVGVGPEPDGPLPTAVDWSERVVTDQSPEAGARVPAGSLVRLWVERGGGSAGVREPRRPKPAPKTAREARYEPTDEAVG
jgi:hypothetical protein